MKKTVSFLLIVLLALSLFHMPAYADSAQDDYSLPTEDELKELEAMEDSYIEASANKLSRSRQADADINTSLDGNWTYKETKKGYAEIYSYLGKSGSLSIPEKVDGFIVEKIASVAFFNNLWFVSVSIPASVKSIGWWAFYGCENLKEVIIHYGVEEIGFGAFMNCKLLKTADIPLSVDKIGADAFGVSCSTVKGIYDDASDSNISVQTYTQNKDFVIYGYKGTVSEKYAKEENRVFKSRGTVKFGDVNCDGKISSADVTLLNDYIKGTKGLGEVARCNADVDNNGTINKSDYYLVEKCVNNLCSENSFPATKNVSGIENYLTSKSIYCDGDSVAKGTGTNIQGNEYYSYCNYIADKNKMKLTMRAVPGTTLAVQADKTGSSRSICERVLEMKGSYDFILLEGGFNDLFQKLPIGEVTADSDKSGKYKTNTTAGAVETIGYFLKKNYSKVPTLFVLCHKNISQPSQSQYWQIIKTALKKWDIPYMDLSEETQLCNINDTISNQYFKYKDSIDSGDGTHPLKYVHEKLLAPLISQRLNEVASDKNELSTSHKSLNMGLTENFKLSANASISSNDSVYKWSSTSPSVAAIDSTGKVVAKSIGTADINVCTKYGKTALCKVTVKKAPTYFSLNKTSINIGVGETYDLNSSFPSSMASASIVYSSSNTKVAGVKASGGLVTGKTIGTATIIAKAFNGVTATCVVTVKKAPSSISLNKTRLTLGIGESFDLNSSVPSGTASYLVEYSSSNTAVAPVKASGGIVTGKSEGTATITAKTYNGKTAKCSITVKQAPSSISLNKTAITIGVGETYDLNSSLPANTASYYVGYTSDKTYVASVKLAGGLVTGNSVGTAKITATTFNGKKAVCKVTVKQAPSSISLNRTWLTLSVGQSFDLNSSVPKGTASFLVVYSSSNSKVAPVKASGGIVTAKAKGNAVITAKTYNGKTAYCYVTVK